ncbi:winged helix-turn-helix domain-containing protein [Undibacterium sp. Ren11W]|uniref:winged helix-turn-helix domain-containing protein n=1 Tax=Undibacterium sp. Ren11W TaxID=3413045 RepID=UPI003BF10A75
MYSQIDKDNFFNAVESLKKYRRADLLDEKGKNLLETLYTDLLPNEHILRKSVKENTTFLVGRKGTGKSTIFLRIEQELRKKPTFLPCYLDVKTIYESAQTDFLNLEYLSDYLPQKVLKKYLIERSFLQTVLIRIASELEIRCEKLPEKFLQIFGETRLQAVKKQIAKLKKKIEDNEGLKEIEIPVIKNISTKRKTSDQSKTATNTGSKNNASIEVDAQKIGVKLGSEEEARQADESSAATELEENFSSVFLQVFQIKAFIEDIKSILIEVDIKHVVVLLDDFSEIDDFAIKTFVDVILAPLNNWSEEFIKFKVAAYPDRIYYGKIDPGKIDTINLDFFSLYSEFDRNKMEEGAIDFTKRLIEKRFLHFLKKSPENFFDITKIPMEDYYEIIFQTSMNVPRIIGYVLSYCYQSKIIYDKPINRQDIEAAAQKYYDDKIEPFFHKTTFSLLSINEKIDTLQLRELLSRFVEKMVETKRRISTGEYSGETYISAQPYSSHFYFSQTLERFLKTLELNFFISKYTEMSDKDGQLSSIYCLNYGLTQKNNLMWGKPKGSKYRKYFNQRPFSFNILLKEFLSSSKSVHCTNEECSQIFSQEQIPFLEFSNYKCNKCGGTVITEAVAHEITAELKKIEQNSLLNPVDVDIVMELTKHNEPLTAKEIAEEIDVSSQSIGQKCKMLDLKKGLIVRNKGTNLYTYQLSSTAKILYE